MPSADGKKLTRKLELNPNATPFIPSWEVNELNPNATPFIPSWEVNASPTSNPPIPIFDMSTRYDDFSKYLLTREELHRYSFPIEDLDQPGGVLIRNDRCISDGSSKRICYRCSRSFYVMSNGQYESYTTCQYHDKKWSQDYRTYPCCIGNYIPEGCVTRPYHVTTQYHLHGAEFVNSKSGNSSSARTVYALDCEMVYTTAGMEVVKVGIVGVDSLTVYESFVSPRNMILDYNTVYSGVTEDDLEGVTTTLTDVQTHLLSLLNNESILVGHSLESDLKALKLIHEKIVDTSVVYLSEETQFRKKSLKTLAHDFLRKQIQQSGDGHNPIEDAQTCMKLMLHKIKLDMNNRKLPPLHI